MRLTPNYRISVLVVSFVISFIGIYVGVGMAEQLRQSLTDDRNVHGYEVNISRSKKHLLYLIAFGTAVGAVGVWGMHHASLYALDLEDDQGNSYPIRSNVGIQLLTLVMVSVTTTAGLMIAAYDDMFSKTKLAIVDEFIAESKRLSMREIKSITLRKVLITIATKKLGRLLCGGVVGAGGMIIMLYVSMCGLDFNGYIRYNVGLVVLAVLVSVLSIQCGYWIFFRLLSIFPDQEWLRLATSIVGSFAATAGNYIMLFSCEFHSGTPYRLENFPSQSWNSYNSFVVAFTVSNGLIWVIAMYVMITARSANQRQGKLLRQAEAILFKIADEHNISMFPQSLKGAQAFGMTSTSTVRTLVEQYLIKRCASEVLYLQHQQRMNTFNTQGTTPNSSYKDTKAAQSILEKHQQANMGFGEFLSHLVLLLATCQWRKFVHAIQYEMSIDSGSNNSANGNDLEMLAGDGLDLHLAAATYGAPPEGAAGQSDVPGEERVLSLAELSEVTRRGVEDHLRVISDRIVHGHSRPKTSAMESLIVSSIRRSSRIPTPKVVPTMDIPITVEEQQAAPHSRNVSVTVDVTVQDEPQNRDIEAPTISS